MTKEDHARLAVSKTESARELKTQALEKIKQAESLLDQAAEHNRLSGEEVKPE